MIIVVVPALSMPDVVVEIFGRCVGMRFRFYLYNVCYPKALLSSAAAKLRINEGNAKGKLAFLFISE